MSNETTQLQKTIKIAVKDGWMESFIKSDDGETIYDKGNNVLVIAETLLESYTTDLNYLMPIAVKVYKELNNVFTQESTMAQSRIECSAMGLKLDSNNQYSELFNSLYEAVILLEHERA